MKLKIAGLIILLWSVVVHSQTSLYSGINPYNRNLKTGDMVRVNVNNNFSVNLSGDYNRNFEVKLKLIPDNKNLPFLKQSESSRANIRKSKEKQTVVEKFSFVIPATVTLQNDGRLQITGTTSVSSNGKITQVVIGGIVSEKSVNNGTINSSDIINLNLQILSKPAVPKDQTLVINENKEESEVKGFTEAEIKKYVNQYLQEVLGGLE